MTVGTPASDRELVLTGLIDAPRDKLFRAWTEPELLKQRFAQAPYTTPVAELDVRPSGANLIVMRYPECNESPNRGIYLEVVENERLVFPDAYTEAWPPRGQRRLFISRRPGAKPRVSTPVQRYQYLPCRRKPGFEPLVLTKGTVLFASIIIDLRLSPRREEATLSRKGGTERCYGAGGEEMATSSLHLTMECPDAPAERLEQVPRRPRPK